MYANFGTEKDFRKLKAMGVSVKNKIVLMRQGRVFRGNKVCTMPKYRKLPFMSPGNIQLPKGFLMGLSTEGLYPGGAYKRTKKKSVLK